MRHPEDLPSPNKRRSPLSPLMQAKSKAATGEQINFCPYGCPDTELDEHGYCYHLIGFTIPGDNKHFEPFMPPVSDEKSIEVGVRKTVGKKIVEKKGPGGRVVGRKRVSAIEEVQKGDELVLISVSSRVYRKIPKPAWWSGMEESMDVIEDDEEDARETAKA
jgi:hypothetical protein